MIIRGVLLLMFRWRGTPTPLSTLPSDLVYKLRNDVGLSAGEIAAVSLQEAVERMQRYWTGN